MRKDKARYFSRGRFCENFRGTKKILDKGPKRCRFLVVEILKGYNIVYQHIA
jgi:hypothetical protein